MALAYSVAVRNGMLTEIVDAASAGYLRIYDGTRPATGGAATTLLAELTLSGPAGTVSGGFCAFSTITADSSANATGTATWFRVTAANGTTQVIDGNVSTAASDLNLNTLAISAGAQVSVTSFTITEGNP